MVGARIAIIPARGGSKRIPRKNIVEFHGLPLIVWTIRAAIDSRLFSRVIVSTEDEEIAEVSRRYGAEAPFLRVSNSDDFTPVSCATIEALQQAEEYYGQEFETVVQLMANCPLRDAHDIQTAVSSYEAQEAEFQLSCFRYGWMNPWWAFSIDDNGRANHVFPEAFIQRSQDLPPLYCPTGAIWIANSRALRVAGTFYGPNHKFICLSWLSAVDIDDEADLAMAKACFEWKRSQEMNCVAL